MVQRCVELFEDRRLESDVTCLPYICVYENTIGAPSLIVNELLRALLALPKRVKGDKKRAREKANKLQ